MARALVSVTDKTGLVPFVQGLVALGYEIVSTGGTAALLRTHAVDVVEAGDLTGFGEMLDGRVKTLHPAVHGGLLADLRKPDHRAQLESAGIQPFDIVCVNLYAFEQTVTVEHDLEAAVESIDIGGPAMVRASAKNFANVAVVVDPADYDSVLASAQVGTLDALRMSLAAKAFRHTAYYDSLVSRYLTAATGADPLTETWTVGFKKLEVLRYGENMHQPAAVYADPLASPGIAQAKKLWGKELSYNNYLDADAAWELVLDLPPNSCAVIKHGNPCGAAACATLAESYRLAKSSDVVSAFGGIAAFNGVVDADAAGAMTEKGNFLEVVVAAGFSDEAVQVFQSRSGWGQDVRLLVAPIAQDRAGYAARAIRGGVLVQAIDRDPESDWQIVTKAQPSAKDLAAMKMAWAIVPHVKSNAIVLADSQQLVGVGAGQMNRVQSVRLALAQAGDSASRCALASDAFFPFPDSIEAAHEAGIRLVVQPGGSKKDSDVIAAADERGIVMALTGVRHFRH